MRAAQRLLLLRAVLRASAPRRKSWEQLFADSVIGVLIGLIAPGVRGPLARGGVGELGLYQSGTQIRSARTDRETRLYRLSREALEQMQANDPQLLAAVHQLMASLLAQRLSRVDQDIQLLLR